MDSVNVIGHEIKNLITGKDKSYLFNGVLVILVAVKLVEQFERNLAAAHLDHAVDLVVVGYRHDSRNDGYGDTGLASLEQEVVEHLVVKEELGVEELHAGILLYLEEFNVRGYAVSLRMLLRVAGSRHTELAVIFAFYV